MSKGLKVSMYPVSLTRNLYRQCIYQNDFNQIQITDSEVALLESNTAFDASNGKPTALR